MGTISVKTLSEGVHSGKAGGIIPSSFRVLRQVLDRIEDSKTGEIVSDFNVKIPDVREKELTELVDELGERSAEYPLL